MSVQLHTLLLKLRRGLRAIYDDRLRAVMLYGSHARREAVAGSDIDVLVVLDDFSSIATEISRSAALVAALSLAHNCVVSLLPVREADWLHRQTPLLINARREAIAIR